MTLASSRQRNVQGSDSVCQLWVCCQTNSAAAEQYCPGCKMRDPCTEVMSDAVRQIPSSIARLVFLSQFRDPNTGVYSCPASQKAEGHQIDCTLRRLHEETFSEWLNYGIEKQKADLDLYFSSLVCGSAAARTWLRLESYRLLVPASATRTEKRLFFRDIETVLHVIAQQTPLPKAPASKRRSVERTNAGLNRSATRCTLNCSGTGILSLTEREWDVLRLIGHGKITKEIADALRISAATVSEHRKHICKKLNLHSTGEIVACALGCMNGTCRRS